jgi:cation diffusion facilitator CzcD-associated flavoprotein CzcO
MKRNKITADVEHRLTKVEEAAKNLYDEIKAMNKVMDEKIDEVKDYITKNLATAIDETNKDLKILLDRKESQEAVKLFLTNFLRLSVGIFGLVSAMATGTWAVTQIIHFFRQ